jgi:hypothetical protein
MVEFFMLLEDMPYVSARTGGESSSAVVARRESNRWPDGPREEGRYM